MRKWLIEYAGIYVTKDVPVVKTVERERPDILCHHAAQIDVRRSMSDPRHDVDVNLGGS